MTETIAGGVPVLENMHCTLSRGRIRLAAFATKFQWRLRLRLARRRPSARIWQYPVFGRARERCNAVAGLTDCRECGAGQYRDLWVKHVGVSVAGVCHVRVPVSYLPLSLVSGFCRRLLSAHGLQLAPVKSEGTDHLRFRSGLACYLLVHLRRVRLSRKESLIMESLATKLGLDAPPHSVSRDDSLARLRLYVRGLRAHTCSRGIARTDGGC